MIKNTTSKLKLTALAACMAAGLAANPANATITVYEKDNFKYKLKGDWQIQLAQNEVSDGGSDQDINVEFDDLEIRHLVTYDLGGGMTALGQVHTSWNRNGDASGNNTFEEAFIGFDFGGHQIVVGKTNSAGDEFGVEKAYEGVGPDDDAFNNIADAGDDLIRYDGGFGPVSIAASYEIEAESETSGNETFFDVFASVKFAGVKLAAAYQDFEEGTTEKEGFGVSASYAVGPVDFGVDFSTVDDGTEDDTEIVNVVAGVKVGPTGYIGVGYVNQDEGDGADDLTGWYANYTYKFAKASNVRLIAEVGDNDGEDASGDDTDLGYLLGMRILF